ncbi:MAG: DUF2975 domain-containing protein [Bacteroidales bacterium]|nr:DUF2975 domain-containing protein [Bacteroidales bacterium]
MKRISINILCILIIGILSISVLLPGYYLGSSFAEGMRMGYRMADSRENADVNINPVEVYFEPSSELIVFPKDTITFDDGRRVPVIVKQATILEEDRDVSAMPAWVSGICTLLSLVCLVLLIVEFVKFIININRGQIFVDANVRRLRRFGLYLLCIAFLGIVSGLAQESLVNSLELTLDGYRVSAYWSLPFSNILIGLLALLIAQVWSRGIMLEEELRLTV